MYHARRLFHCCRAAQSHRVILLAVGLLAVGVGPPAARGQGRASVSAGPLLQPDRVVALQQETADPQKGRYDWGPCVIRDGDLYRMWWVRLGGSNKKLFPYKAVLPDGEGFAFTYPDWGDRVYYAESRDGLKWNISGVDYTGPIDQFGPDSVGPLMVLAPAESPQERNHVGNPAVVMVNGSYYMYYETCGEFIVKRDGSGRIQVGNEYHNQVFVATSKDGQVWHKHPDDRDPQPIVAAPPANRQPDRQRYGLGQPSVIYRDGRFVLHYVDSCTASGDFMVRLESEEPFFRKPRVHRYRLQPPKGWPAVPAGGVARFAQTDVKFLGKDYLLVRSAYVADRLGLMASRTGVFPADAAAVRPADVYPQVAVRDPRAEQGGLTLYPRFLTDSQGQVLVQDGKVAIYYASGLGFKDKAYTWDLFRCDVAVAEIEKAARVRLRP